MGDGGGAGKDLGLAPPKRVEIIQKKNIKGKKERRGPGEGGAERGAGKRKGARCGGRFSEPRCR